MSRTDCPSLSTLSDFVLGKLRFAEQSTVAEHLDVCAECEQKTGQLDGIADAVVSTLRRIAGSDARAAGAATVAAGAPRVAGMPGATEPWGEFRIVREIGRGGMGVVYEAYQGSLNRHVALKFLPEHGNLSRFRREAQAAGRLHHTNIVPVFGVGEHEGRHFYVMQYITGRGLDAVSKERAAATTETGRSSGRPGAREMARIGAQVAEALAYAHGQGVIHRDIKPSNLLLDDQGTVWITDFGLAKVADQHDLTGSGDFFGTLRYMPPEAFEGKYDARGDIYALGLTLYEMIARRPAYDETERARLIRLVTSVDPPRLRIFDREVPGDLETVIHKAIERDPGHRYLTAAELAEDLTRFIEDRPILARQASAAERYWRWAKRNPAIAGLSGVLTGVLVLATVCSLLAMDRFRIQAGAQRALASASEDARKGADRAWREEAVARRRTDEVNVSLAASEENLRRTVYATRTNLALAAWEANELGRLRSLVDLLRPASGEPDLRGWEWRYLWQLGHEDRLTLTSQDGEFADVVFCPDGRTLAGLELKGRIQLWDRHTGKLLRTTGAMTQARRAHLAGGVSAIAFSPDGRSLAGPGPDESLALYAVDTGLLTLRFEGSSEAVLKLAWSPDGRTLVAALAKHIMRVWSARDGHRIEKHFAAHDAPVAAVAFSPDGRTIASASYDRTVKLWSPEDRERPRAVLKGHTDEVHAVAFSPDGRQVASAGRDRTLRIWDTASGAALAVMRGHTGLVTSLAYVPNSARVATGSVDETVRVWDTVSQQEIRTFKGHADAVAAVAVSPDGRDFAAASHDATVRVWDALSPPRPRTLTSASVLTYGGDVTCLAFSPDGRRLVSGHDDHALRVWELSRETPLRVIKGHTNGITCVAFTPDGRAVASGSVDRTVRLWDAATGEPLMTFAGHTDVIQGLVFSPDGPTIFSSGSDRTIRAWDPATGVGRFVLAGHSDAVGGLALSPDGRTLASASADKTCILWDLGARRPRVTLRGHSSQLHSVAFSPDGLTLATSSDDRTVRLWNAADGAPRGSLEGHIAQVDGLAFAPDGRLASSAQDKTIRLWDPASGQTLLILKGHAGRIRRIAFSPDGRTLASASDDRSLKLWEAAPAAALAGP